MLEGAPVDVIDQALVDWGFPVGPLMLLDEVGIDVAAHVGGVMLEAFGDRIEPPRAIGTVMADDRKGRKNGKGFYLYGDLAKRAGKGKHVDPTIYARARPRKADAQRGRSSIDDIQMRCALQFVNEALHCFGEGILRSARDGDVGAIFGLGFPPFRGGPFRSSTRCGPAPCCGACANTNKRTASALRRRPRSVRWPRPTVRSSADGYSFGPSL